MLLIEQWYHKYKDHIVAIYTYGSRANPYIHNPDDYDYAVFTPNDESYWFLNAHRRELEDEHTHIALFRISEFNHKPRKAGDYIHHYIAPVIGYFSDANYNILYCEDEYREVLRTLAPSFPYQDADNPSKTNKRWYHVLQGLFILENFSFKLSPEQEEIINLAHQGQCPRYWYEWAYDKLGLQITDDKPEPAVCNKPKRKMIIKNGKKLWIEA